MTLEKTFHPIVNSILQLLPFADKAQFARAALLMSLPCFEGWIPSDIIVAVYFLPVDKSVPKQLKYKDAQLGIQLFSEVISKTKHSVEFKLSESPLQGGFLRKNSHFQLGEEFLLLNRR